MPRPLTVAPHLSVSELEDGFRRCSDAVEKIHWQAIVLAAQGRRSSEVAEICGYNPDWVRRLIRRFNKLGPDGLRDRRQTNGRSRLLSDEQLVELRDAVLHETPPGGGLWTGPKVASWMSEKLSRPISPQTAWDYLKLLGMSKQTPRPRHARASAEKQDAFKKKLRRRLAMIGRHHPHAAVELWAQDEARIGLVPIVRRVWARRGERPQALQRRSYEWLYVYGFVRPSTGQVEWLLLPTVNTELFQLSLDIFANSVGAGPDKRIVLVVDQAGWHMTRALRIPEGLHLLPLPPYSPELQPSEKLWPLLHETVANEDIVNMDDLEERLVSRCRELRRQPHVIFGHTLFDWWAHAAMAERDAA